MSFDEFQVRCHTRPIHYDSQANIVKSLATTAPGLEKDEVALVLCLLKKVRQTCKKDFMHGRYSYLIPVSLRYDGSDPGIENSENAKHATFFSLPYFCLRPLRTLKHLTDGSSQYPTRSLLQSHYRLESTYERDKRQVVRELGRWRNGEALYLPDLWCVVVNKSTL
jgi:hypothetical protein